MAPERKQSALDWGAAALKSLLPIIAIGWYGAQTINRIEAKAGDAIDSVRGALVQVQLAQANHEAKDDQRQVDIERRVGHVEERQDGLERVLGQLGIGAAIAEDRRPRLRVPVGGRP